MQGVQPLAGGSGGVLQVETFLEAASEAGMQGAQPLPGGLGGVPPAPFFIQLPVSPQAKRAIEVG